MVSRLRLNWEIAPYILLALIAAGMRLWDLGSRAIAHDESLGAYYSWYLANGQGYQHMPMMHGPFQFHGTALNFFLFGDSDFTARLLPALFGVALVVLPYFLRRHLGRWGSLAVATLLAFSPTLLYFSRFVRNDIYSLFWTLLLVICLWRYIEERKARYLYIGAAALSLSFSTKEVSYITVGILSLFLLIVAGRELIARARRSFDLSQLSAPGEYLILIGTLSLPLFAAGIELIPGVELTHLWAKALVVLSLFMISAAIGLRWNVRRWLLSVLIFYGIFALLYTTFFTNISGFVSGIWGSMEYWMAQQEVARGGQPWYYYILLLSFYEFLPLSFAFIGAIYYVVRGNLFSRFLVYWVALSLIAYSLFGEKMPWLSLHIALPMILLGGNFIGRLFQEVDWRRVRASAPRAIAVLALLLLFAFTVPVAFQASYQRGDEPPQMLVYAGISSAVPRIRGQIEGLAEETGEGKELRITVDSPLTWPWVWYLRDYAIDYPHLSTIDRPPAGTVLLLSAGNEQAAQPYLEKYGEGQRFRQLLWFPEEYRDFNLGWWWDYLRQRKTLGPYWTTEGIAYFPRSAP
ncbi:MAG: flippase activity-associated protein Agl23 [Dehalococcoidia bacterium]